MGILHPAILQQLVADLVEVDQRHGARFLFERDGIDRHLVHPLDAANLDLLDPEAGIARLFGDRRADRAGNAEDLRDDQRRTDCEREDRPGRDALQRVLADRQPIENTVDDRGLLLLALGRGPACGGPPVLEGGTAHASASSMIICTSSG